MLMVSLSSIVPSLAISSTLPATNPSEPSIISCTSGLLACAYIVEPSSGSVIEAKRPDSGASLERVKLPISSPFGPESGNIVASPLLTDLPFPAEISLELFFNALAAGAHIEFSPIAGELPPPIVVPPTPFALLPPAPEPTAFEFLPEPLLTLFVLLLLPPLPLIAATAPATVPARPPAFPDNPLAIEPAFLKSIAKPSPACNVVNPRVCKCLSIAVPSLHQETIIITLKQREFALFNVPLRGEVKSETRLPKESTKILVIPFCNIVKKNTLKIINKHCEAIALIQDLNILLVDSEQPVAIARGAKTDNTPNIR